MITSAEEFVALRLSEAPDEYLRAAHEEATEHTWREVIEKYPDMRFWVAQNKTVPVSILEILATDPDTDVRHMVASKGKTPVHVIEMLAEDPDVTVRMCVARHRKAPAHVLQKLVSDEWDEIRRVARERLEASNSRS